MMRAAWVLVLGLAVLLHPSGSWGAKAREPGPLEELQYQVDLGVWQDVARVRLRLAQVGPGRYRAEFVGAAQGAWKLLSRWLPERYETEMALEGGRFKPLVYHEWFQCKGRRISKEYRFDYSRGILEIWRGVDGREPVKDWQGPLSEPVYDPLTLLYNLRLGALGHAAGGQTLRVNLIPSPEPREMVINLGADTAQGRKVMVTVKTGGPGAGDGPYFFFCTSQWVPQGAWFRVLPFAKLSGKLLNPGEVMDGLPACLQLSQKAGENR